MSKSIRILLLGGALVALSLLDGSAGAGRGGLELTKFDGGMFSVEVPRGWKVTPAGACDTFGFLARDPSRRARQLFFFSLVGPLYMSQRQKTIDQQYMRNGGYPVGWSEMPVVDPLTPDNFLLRFQQVATTSVARNYLPGLPALQRIEIVSSRPTATPFSSIGGRAALMRALFIQDGELVEGLFHATVAPFMQFMNGPGGGTGYGIWFVGVTAPKAEFRRVEADLLKSMRSFRLSEDYVRQCAWQQKQAFDGVMRAGQTLRETSDIIVKGWEARSRVEDVLSEKRSDAMLGKERLYSESTGEVYEFENGFYDGYRLDPSRHRLDDLRPLADDAYDLWDRATLNGYRHLN